MSASVAAQLACEALMVRSYRLIDEGRASHAAGLFTEDATFTVTGGIDLAGRAALADVVDSYRRESRGWRIAGRKTTLVAGSA